MDNVAVRKETQIMGRVFTVVQGVGKISSKSDESPLDMKTSEAPREGSRRSKVKEEQ